MAESQLFSEIWAITGLLAGTYKQAEYGKVILPFTVLRRLDCVLEPTKSAVLAELAKRTSAGLNPAPFLSKVADQSFYNTSKMDLKMLAGDQDNVAANLRAYVDAFSPSVRDIFERFDLSTQIDRLADAGLVYLITETFSNIDMRLDVVGKVQMATVFEELIRTCAELSNETAGDRFTPRDVIRLMVNMLFVADREALQKSAVIRSLYDPAAGTGGMLSVADEYLDRMNPSARLVNFGQELNAESYATCKSNMLIKGQDITHIVYGNTLSADGLQGERFDYALCNPPLGETWETFQKAVRKESEEMGFDGRFGPGLPRVSDSSLLFLLHLLSKMRLASEGGCRFGIVLNGSPLFTGGAGSGESEIRRYLLEHDLVEAIVALPVDIFFDSPITTYVWIVSNRKEAARKGKLQLIDASSFWHKMRKSLGKKRKELSDENINDVTRLYAGFEEQFRDRVPISKIFRNEDFGYRKITVERPKRNAAGEILLGTKGKVKGKPVANPALRDTENVPLSEDIDAYFEREVLPQVPDAWVDHTKTQEGYEIPFNRHFYVFKPPRPLDEIDAELEQVSERILTMIKRRPS